MIWTLELQGSWFRKPSRAVSQLAATFSKSFSCLAERLAIQMGRLYTSLSRQPLYEHWDRLKGAIFGGSNLAGRGVLR
jgi:hypothetical protein